MLLSLSSSIVWVHWCLGSTGW